MTDHTGIVDAPSTKSPSRRDVLRRGAVVGGSLLWLAPTVQILDLSAKAAATTSGQTTGSYPSNFVVILNIKAIPPGCTGWPAVGTNVGVKYDPGIGFDRPDPSGTGNCLNTVPGNPAYDNNSNHVKAVTDFLNSHPSLATVSQSTMVVGTKTAPAYTLVITNTYFKPAKKSNNTYGPIAFAKNGQACNLPSYLANSPSGFDTYKFPGNPG